MQTYKTVAEVRREVRFTGLPKIVSVECQAADINFGHDRNMAALIKQHKEVYWSYTFVKGS